MRRETTNGDRGLGLATIDDAHQTELTRARLAALVTSCADPIIGETLDGIITDWNPAAERLYGYTAAEAIGQPIAMLAPPDRVDEVATLLERVRRGESVEAFETVRRARDGRLINVSLTVFPVLSDGGEVIGASATTRDISGRIAASAALEAAHQRTRDVLERIPDAFLAVGRDWRLIDVNAAAERMLRRERAELLGLNIWQALDIGSESPFAIVSQRALEEGRAASIEFACRPVEAWFDAHIDPMPEGLSIFLRDVTATHRLTRDLRASEAKYRALVDQLPAVVYLMAADERETPLYFSPYLEILEGIHPDDAVRRGQDTHWLDLVHPDDRERVAAMNRQVVASGERFQAEYRTMRTDGSYVWIRDDCVPIFDEEGTAVAWQGVLLDISDRIDAEDAQARLAAIVEGAEDAIISRTLDGTITSWNRGAEQLYGYSAEEMIGQSLERIMPDPGVPDPRAWLEELHDQPKRFEATRRRADGSLIDVALSLSPIRDRSGAMVGVSSITRDITARKRAEEELRVALEAARAATRAKSGFLAMLSHELRTPLQAVLGYADFLLAGPSGSLSPEQREDIDYIHQGATRMASLIDQMLDLSRMEAGRLELAISDVSLPEVIEQVRQDVTPQAEAKGLALEIALSPALPLVRADANRLRQILVNLAGNAVKFTDAGAVRISAAPTADGGVDIAVSDTGIGIAPDALERIFEEFQQVHSAATRRHGGAGLGLAIARGLAEQMGGRISVESEPGVGSTFTVWVMGRG